MSHSMVEWLRPPAPRDPLRARWARFIGRNWARVSYGRRIEPTWLELTSTSLALPNLGDAFAGFRIVQLSDFHCSRLVTTAYLAEAVELAMAQSPDL